MTPRDRYHEFKINAIRGLRRLGVDPLTPHRRAAGDPLTVARLAAGADAKIVLDCGAHQGRMTRAFRGAFPAAKIHAFEPTPATFADLKARVGAIPNVEVINAAVGGKSGEMEFFVGANEQSNSLVRPQGGGGGASANSIRVPVVGIADFCRERGIDKIDVLKLDIEGYELETLRGMEPMLRDRRVKVIYSEVTFERKPEEKHLPTFFDLHTYLSGLGYRFVGIYDVLYGEGLRFDWGDAIWVAP